MATQACCSSALQLRANCSISQSPIAQSSSSSCRALGKFQNPLFRRAPSSSRVRRFPSGRAVPCRSEIKPVSSPPRKEEPVTPVSVVDKDGKLDGVIAVEREDAGPRPTWGRIYTLAAGDVAFLLLFAAIGRLSHGFPVLDWDTVRTADPFLAGWFVGSYFTGGYGPEGQGLDGLKTASAAAARSWVAALPIALAVRGFTIGHVPPTPFIVVSLASTFVLQVGWRTAYTAAFPNDKATFLKKKENRKGSPFEFFGLLTSLVKRW